MTKRIGGYFELELGKRNELHSNALALNSGRNCLKHILLSNNFTKIYLPYYTCEVLLEPIKQCNIEFEFYHVDKQLNPLLKNAYASSEAILYINYFGIKSETIIALSSSYKNLIIDNSQSLFSDPIDGVHTFYSPRKFMGLPDGGFVYSHNGQEANYETEISEGHMSHLVKRIEQGAENGYADFSKNDDLISHFELKKMSKLTSQLIENADIEDIKQKRINNFSILHKALSDRNELDINISEIDPPMVYPLLIKNGGSIREKLIKNKIFVASYWQNILPYIPDGAHEKYLIDNIVPLPIDQRITAEDLKTILNFL